MDCSRYRRHIAERTLEIVRDPPTRVALERHLAGCRACANFEREERQLTDALTLLRTPLPVEIDVAERTRRAAIQLGKIRRTETDPRTLAGIAGLGAIAASLFGIGLVFRLPEVIAALRIAGARVELLADRIQPLIRMSDLIRDAAVNAVRDLAHSLLPVLATIESPLRLLLGLAYLAMAGFVVLVLSREWRFAAASSMESSQ